MNGKFFEDIKQPLFVFLKIVIVFDNIIFVSVYLLSLLS